ncbi:MAG: DNA-processing protein DprA [Candidatus Beckwithbacteria bacterium]|nr:DNA-processing protein DprA [Candidatus Beckwithbacteria bacterium]
MDQNELKYWVGLSGFRGLGIKRLKLLRQYFGSIKKIYEANSTGWIKLGIKPEMAKNWQKRDLDKEMEVLAKSLIKVITIEDKRYPKLLKEIDSPPFVLFVKGQIEVLNQPSLAVVGTRQPTTYGCQAVQKLVQDLVKNKLVIISGLARGIDGLVHRNCLVWGGKTVAVLGHGLERVYPPENRPLSEEIVAKGGALVTEYPLNFPISKTNFPQRDRIMAGLSLGTLVIEGGEKSGTKITANFAADYGREVFCVPGPIGSPQSEGPAQLIQQGAKLVTKVEDILEELNLI